MWRLTLVAIVLSACFAIRAFATDINDVFKTKTREIPARLVGLGYTGFGSLDLNTFLAHSSGIRARFSDKVEKLNSNGRLSAHWQIVGGVPTVFVDQPWWNKFPEQQPVLALHEALGVLGFVDDQYWLSTSMWFLSLRQTQDVLDLLCARDGECKVKERIANWIVRNADTRLPKGTSLAGGVVGVGGGGEGGSLWMKMHMLLRCLDELSRPQSAEDRAVTLGSLAHALSSPLTVTWGNRGLKR